MYSLPRHARLLQWREQGGSSSRCRLFTGIIDVAFLLLLYDFAAKRCVQAWLLTYLLLLLGQCLHHS